MSILYLDHFHFDGSRHWLHVCPKRHPHYGCCDYARSGLPSGNLRPDDQDRLHWLRPLPLLYPLGIGDLRYFRLNAMVGPERLCLHRNRSLLAVHRVRRADVRVHEAGSAVQRG